MGQHKEGELIFDAGGLTTGPLSDMACMVGYISANLQIIIMLASELPIKNVSWQQASKLGEGNPESL